MELVTMFLRINTEKAAVDQAGRALPFVSGSSGGQGMAGKLG